MLKLLVSAALCVTILHLSQGEPLYSNRFGNRQQYFCHCKNNAACNSDTGDCPNNECDDRWFGQSCQFVALKYNVLGQYRDIRRRKQCGNYGNDVTRLEAHLMTPQSVSWLRFVFKHDATLTKGFYVRYTLINNKIQSCTQAGTWTYLNYSFKSANLYCPSANHVRTVILYDKGGGAVKQLCDLYISGGQNIALGATNVQQSTTAKDGTEASAAVDGNMPFHDRTDGCAQTSDSTSRAWWRISFEKPQDVYSIKILNFRGACPDNWFFSVESQTCLQYKEQELNRKDAREDCKNSGADLVKIVNDKMNNFITDYILEVGTASFWIGLNDRHLQSSHTWLDEEDEANYTHFAPDEPNDATADQKCVFMCAIAGDCSVWRDDACEKVKNYFCEKKAEFKDFHGRLRSFGVKMLGPEKQLLYNYNSTPSGQEIEYLIIPKLAPKNVSHVEISVNSGQLALCEIIISGARCPTGFYEEDCSKTCGACLFGLCNPQTGLCYFFGCEPGYKGEYCNETCPENTYGRDCRDKCGQFCYGCERFYGECYSCHTGYAGKFCQDLCPNGSYGQRCESKCRPSCDGCDPFNGSCKKCKAGYMGQDCEEACPSGSYGVECASTCGAFCDACDHIYGICDGCHAGYIGEFCDYVCPNGTYGIGCNFTCEPNCNGCDHMNGECETCQAGFTGRYCREVCPKGRYGEGCNSTCSHRCRVCHHISGCIEVLSTSEIHTTYLLLALALIILAMACCCMALKARGKDDTANSEDRHDQEKSEVEESKDSVEKSSHSKEEPVKEKESVSGEKEKSSEAKEENVEETKEN